VRYATVAAYAVSAVLLSLLEKVPVMLALSRECLSSSLF
jgi:hypothetical protein